MSTGATGTTSRTTTGTGPSGNQTAGSQASGAPLGSSAAQQQANTGGVPSTYPGTGTTAKFEWPESYKRAYTYVMEGGLFTLLIFIWAIIFHAGAAVLSYRKYGSMAWAILDFFFASFYYPYYVFSLDTSAAPQPAPLIGGSLLKKLGLSKSRRR